MGSGTHWRRAAAIVGVVGLLAGACGDDDSAAQDTSPPSPTSEETTVEATDAPAEGAPATDGAGDSLKVAWLNASSANTFLQAAREGMDGVAAEHGIEITEFDAQFDPDLQQRQLRDAIASGEYDGIILTAIVGPALIPDVEEAVAEGLEVVVLNQIVGDDLSTSDPQVDGVAASVASPPATDGERVGEATVMACEDVDPCRVVYFYGQKGIPFDEEGRAGFDRIIAEHPNISVVAEGESGFEGPDQAFQQLQDILVSNPDFEVVVGADQGIAGVELALSDAGKSGVKLIASGGSSAAVDAIEEGRWFASVFAAPRTEGELAMQAMVDALDGRDAGGMDAIDEFPDHAIITPENVGEFEAQWAG
jgi:ribose transport system substrate-binding protein